MCGVQEYDGWAGDLRGVVGWLTRHGEAEGVAAAECGQGGGEGQAEENTSHQPAQAAQGTTFTLARKN